jgi:hypothetical protein
MAAGCTEDPCAGPEQSPAVTGRQPHLLLRRIAIITVGSLMFVILKTGLVALIHSWIGIPAWLNYLTVTVSITFVGWVYHSKISFQIPLRRQTLGRYVQQAIALKVVDYVVFNGLVYVAGVNVCVAVLITGALVFTTRVVVYVKYVFLAPNAVPAG